MIAVSELFLVICNLTWRVSLETRPWLELIIHESILFLAVYLCSLVFESNGIDLNKPVVLMCGGGVVSPVVAFAAHLIDGNNLPVYDVSYIY